MITRKVKVTSKNGLHARPAAMFVKAVGDCGQEIIVSFDGESADADSLLDVMSLGIDCGDEVELSCKDDSAEGVLDQLAQLLATELD